MSVYVFPLDKQGCGYYRMIWPAKALRSQGNPVVISYPDKSGRLDIKGGMDTRTGKMAYVNVPDDAEVVVFQRVGTPMILQAVTLLRDKGVAVVVDMDDDLARIDPNNPAFGYLHPRNERANWANAQQACLDATLVTVSTPALLKRYAPHGRGVVLENAVPARYLDVPHIDNEFFGWPGTVWSHPNDLQQVGASVDRLIREGYLYLGVGPVNGLVEVLRLTDGEPRVTGTVEIERYPQALAQLGVGLAPLADTQFNAAKSWLKPLELMACGVPWVASPRAEYSRLQKRTGAGLLARKPQDWYRTIKMLLDNDGFRSDMSAEGRAAAADLTIEGNAWRWWEAWTEALRIQRGPSATITTPEGTLI